jgi:hypothetical protein
MDTISFQYSFAKNKRNVTLPHIKDTEIIPLINYQQQNKNEYKLPSTSNKQEVVSHYKRMKEIKLSLHPNVYEPSSSHFMKELKQQLMQAYPNHKKPATKPISRIIPSVVISFSTSIDIIETPIAIEAPKHKQSSKHKLSFIEIAEQSHIMRIRRNRGLLHSNTITYDPPHHARQIVSKNLSRNNSNVIQILQTYGNAYKCAIPHH